MKQISVIFKTFSLFFCVVLTACGGGGASGSASSAGGASLGSIGTPQNFVLPSAVSTVPPQ